MSLPDLNADGQAAIVLTDEQKYEFDTRGWLLMPGVLTEPECAEMREYTDRLRRAPESLPPGERSSIGGPLIRLVDYSAIAGFMLSTITTSERREWKAVAFRKLVLPAV